MEDQINREDTKIMQEIADFLADYDFTCGDFIDFMLKMEEEVETVHSGEVHLDREIVINTSMVARFLWLIY